MAGATTWYVSPTGTAAGRGVPNCSSRARPCDLASAAAGAMAGDTVILMDGVYTTQLEVANSGTSSAWITFQADTCATPIIQGPGVGPTDTNQDTGVGSSTATYVRFVGIVSTGWSTGFGNGWTGTDTTTSNGNFEYDDCVADFNGRTGITFFSAQGLKVKNCIVAHNGSSTAESWSSGVTLYEAQGGAGASTIEGNVSFENMDGQKHTDGSGFIIDEYSDGATFINNIAFRNGGSCLRLTKSMNCKFINNSCYHDAQDTADTGPSNPSEVYFTKDTNNSTTTGTSFMNNVFVATGTGPGATAIYNQPTSGWANNQTATGTVTYFTSPDGTNPDFTLASGSALIGKGGSGSGVPSNDIGFDPKCIAKKTPTPPGMMAKGSWWQYSVDLAYIKSIGGVAGCFHAKTRSGTPDIGAYANGSVTKAGTCTPHRRRPGRAGPPAPAARAPAAVGGGHGGTAGSGSGGSGGPVQAATAQAPAGPRARAPVERRAELGRERQRWTTESAAAAAWGPAPAATAPAGPPRAPAEPSPPPVAPRATRWHGRRRHQRDRRRVGRQRRDARVVERMRLRRRQRILVLAGRIRRSRPGPAPAPSAAAVSLRPHALNVVAGRSER